MDIISFNEAATANSRIESFNANPDSTSGVITTPKVIASGETITIPAGRVAVLPNVQVDGTLNILGDVFVPSGTTVGDLETQIAAKQDTLVSGTNIKTVNSTSMLGSGNISVVELSGVTAYHLLQGNLSTTIYANYIETSSTTTRNYTTTDYIFDSINYKLYDCIMASPIGTLLTNTTYFTSITAGTLSINNALIPLAQGIDSNGTKNTIISKNETITGLTYTQGKNYVYCDKNGAYGVTYHKPRYLESELVRTYAGEQPDYFDVESNKWFNTDAGSELVTNGKFDVNILNTNLIAFNGSTFVSDSIPFTHSNGSLLATISAGHTYPVQEKSISTIVGKKYKVKLSTAQQSANVAFIISTQVCTGKSLAATGSIYTSVMTVAGTIEIEFVAQTTTTYIRTQLDSVTVGHTYRVDNITCYPIEITPTTEITESRNYMNHIVHADNDGGVLYVEELPKIEYKDVVKANEFKGKNACTAWVNFDGTTTPPTIRDKDNVSAVIRTATGVYDIYFKEPMDNVNYSCNVSSGDGNNTNVMSSNNLLNKVTYNNQVGTSAGYSNTLNGNIHIFGGKN